MLDGVLSLDCDLLLGLLSLLSDGVCDLGVFGLYPLLSCDLPLLFCLVVELISMEMCANLGFVVESDKKIFDLFPCWLSPVVGSMLAMLM